MRPLEDRRDFEADLCPAVDVAASFWADSATVGEAVSFQIVIPAPTGVPETALSFDSVRFTFPNGSVVTVAPTASGSVELQAVELGDVRPGAASNASGDLTWRPGSARVFRGTITASEESTIALDAVVFALGSNGWKFEVATRPSDDGQLQWLKEAGADSALIPLESLARRCT